MKKTKTNIIVYINKNIDFKRLSDCDFQVSVLQWYQGIDDLK